MTNTAPSPAPLGGWLYSFWKFSRPHTIIGTSLSVVGLYGIALAFAQGSPLQGVGLAHLPSLFWAWLACLAGNIYIVGLNQLEDVEIDQINKPHLPVAAGEFSLAQGWSIVAITGILALSLALWQGLYLLGVVGLSLLIGTAYSLPPVRLKRFPVWAALCILGVRGVIVNLGLFLHFQARLTQSSLGSSSSWQIPPEVWGLTLFVLVFSFAIAIFKDIPDSEGDRQYQISTLTLKLGSRAVFDLSLWVLTACYLGMITSALFWLDSVQPWVLIGSQVAALGLLWGYGRRVDLSQKQQIADFYQLIWKLFFWEYVIFPLVCWLRFL